MLKQFVCEVDVWGGDKVVKETVMADNPKKASQRARDAVQKKYKAPFDMVKVLTVEIVKE
jgi:hypothetical protein